MNWSNASYFKIMANPSVIVNPKVGPKDTQQDYYFESTTAAE